MFLVSLLSFLSFKRLDDLNKSEYTTVSETMSEKTEKQPEENHNFAKAMMFSMFTAVSFAFGYLLLSVVSAKHGTLAGYSQCYSNIGFWMIFHIYRYLSFRSKKENEGKSYFTKENSSYFEEVKFDIDRTGVEVDLEDGEYH